MLPSTFPAGASVLPDDWLASLLPCVYSWADPFGKETQSVRTEPDEGVYLPPPNRRKTLHRRPVGIPEKEALLSYADQGFVLSTDTLDQLMQLSTMARASRILGGADLEATYEALKRRIDTAAAQVDAVVKSTCGQTSAMRTFVVQHAADRRRRVACVQLQPDGRSLTLTYNPAGWSVLGTRDEFSRLARFKDGLREQGFELL